MDYNFIFIFIIIIWYTIFILYLLHFYTSHYKEHAYSYHEKHMDHIPSILSLPKLSMLLYHKRDYSLFLGTVYFLICKKVFRIVEDEKGTHLELSKEKIELSDSQKCIVNLFINIMGDGVRVSFDTIYNYTNGESGRSEFSFNYYMWKRELVQETTWSDYYEVVKCYEMSRFMLYSAIVIFILNLFTVRNIAGFLAVIPSYFVVSSFFKITRRTKEANEEYHKWMAFKAYLESHNDLKLDEKQKYPYLVYGTLLKVGNISSKLHLRDGKEIERLENSINKCIKQSKAVGGFKWTIK